MSKTLAWIFGALGTALLLVAIALLVSRPEPTAGDPQTVVQALGSISSTTTIELDQTPDQTDSRNELPTIDPNPVSRLEEVAAERQVRPVRLRIDAIGIDAPITPAGINDRTGQMAVPGNASDVAWYEHGPAPNEPGSAVLAAHVDLASQGPGVFFDLQELQPGDRVDVLFDDGSTSSFRVAARTVYAKEELPLDAVFSRQGPPVLTLITCGGGFNQTAQRYDSNVVVYAFPAEVSALPAQSN